MQVNASKHIWIPVWKWLPVVIGVLPLQMPDRRRVERELEYSSTVSSRSLFVECGLEWKAPELWLLLLRSPSLWESFIILDLVSADGEVNHSRLAHKRQHHFLLKLLEFNIATALSSSQLIAFYYYGNGNASNFLASSLIYVIIICPSPFLSISNQTSSFLLECR